MPHEHPDSSAWIVRIPKASVWLAVAIAGLAGVGVALMQQVEPAAQDTIPNSIAVVNGVAVSSDPLVDALPGIVQEFGLPITGQAQAMQQALIDQELLFQYGVRNIDITKDEVVRSRVLKLVIEEQDVSLTEPTDDEVEAFFQNNRGRFQRPAMVRFDLVTLPQNEQTSLEDAERSFGRWLVDGNYALRTHESERAYHRAELAQMFGPAFAAAVTLAERGAIVGPVESSLGTHYFRVTEHSESTDVAIDAVRGAVRNQLRQARRQQALSDLLKRLRANAHIEMQ